MNNEFVLGIDCGGTHTDAALIQINKDEKKARLCGAAKTDTIHEALEKSVSEVIGNLAAQAGLSDILTQISRVTLGTTLAVNALVQGKGEKVGLALSAGPGLDPSHFTIGEHFCIVPGGLDHRGVEVGRLDLQKLKKTASAWPEEGVRAAASVGKFSPRNPEHELEMAKIISQETSLSVSCGHSLSGRLDFPRRIATAYYNAAVQQLHHNFLNSVRSSFRNCGINAQARLLRADGGAIPFHISGNQPVQSILSGPAASVMGALAMWEGANSGCALLLDVGGTTTDLALVLNGSPVVDRLGMRIGGRRTLVRSLASLSIGVGGDSLIRAIPEKDGGIKIVTGPYRGGPAAAFGGNAPTLLDALNYLDRPKEVAKRGNVEASRRAMEKFATTFQGMDATQCANLAVENALNSIQAALQTLLDNINAHPVYTLAALRESRNIKPEKACVAGGPAACLRGRLEKVLKLPVALAPHSDVTNAIGAALTLPTASLEVYADTGKRELSAPTLDYKEQISAAYNLEDAVDAAKRLLAKKMRDDGMERELLEIANADMFATLDDMGRGSKDLRVTVQARPGIAAVLEN